MFIDVHVILVCGTIDVQFAIDDLLHYIILYLLYILCVSVIPIPKCFRMCKYYRNIQYKLTLTVSGGKLCPVSVISFFILFRIYYFMSFGERN